MRIRGDQNCRLRWLELGSCTVVVVATCVLVYILSGDLCASAGWTTNSLDLNWLNSEKKMPCANGCFCAVLGWKLMRNRPARQELATSSREAISTYTVAPYWNLYECLFFFSQKKVKFAFSTAASMCLSNPTIPAREDRYSTGLNSLQHTHTHTPHQHRLLQI